MAFYSIGDVAERCGINPVTLRAWQRRYELLKPKRTEGGHRQFDEEDIQRIEEIKRWIESGVSVGKVKALLEQSEVNLQDGWESRQEEMMAVLRQARPAKLRAIITELDRKHSADAVIDQIIIPVRQRLILDLSTARSMSSLFDGALIDYASSCLVASRKKAGRNTLLMSWDNGDRARLWLEAWRLSQRSWHVDVLSEPLENPRPELFPGQHVFLWTGNALTQEQQEQMTHWKAQGYDVAFHAG
ncbi:MerR family transcriptional regulator [Pantoea coffeiphila]|uniref:MerR family transcriptional regulator n=1 Tax=Pantoea coffeiphila TaxID=1465635 RepID=UPI0019606A7B|nr:MerR family transcriptional regulator [Pantoea coffeiphila]MBM7341602.1 DNA-binding transcriptional MerR regulator [Pantoea coffeiphila]